MLFARQTTRVHGVDLSRFIDTPRQQKDPCFECSLPFCNDRSKECAFLNTNFGSGRTTLRQERQELISELIEEGVIVQVTGNGFIHFADDTETADERRRRQNREHMRRVREQKRCHTTK